MEISAENQLEASLENFEKETSHEIAVATVNSLQEVTIEEFAVELFAEWGIGKKGADNGVLILVAPNERSARIEVGYGMEGALTDAKSSEIMQNILIPAFKGGDFSGGIAEAANIIMQIAKGEIVDVPKTAKMEFTFEQLIMLIFFAYIFIYRPTASLRKSKWGTKFTYRAITAIWLPIFFALGTAVLFASIMAFVFVFGIILDILFWRFFKDTPDEKMPWWIFAGRGGSGGFGGSSGGFSGFGGGFSGGGGASGRW